ncbi:uncharacterized protein TOT_020000823 [Theileria orientalis strain Shintoku]|uniref:Uncharacterized protein n=1 Tax=Theileria orientalis strain Shintoku TaxID=869250 RepID=J4C8C9_THEOR|nr:uncharacterized protein TOT_020000823 [Theileria orientalis strain Shintoku]BAM40568.1 uncharacterized protein TOT_020000823 [Theileria orientalis strain Shintoku]|eukprot:XP_009690869.1 uncharacterized protein TOT_020000823 [Theileria orientalis strain Shintoku]
MSLFYWLIWLFTYVLVFHCNCSLESDSFFTNDLRPAKFLSSYFRLEHILLTVDIANKFNTQGLQYAYDRSQDSHTFTANPGYLINKVTRRGAVLWDAKDYDCQCSFRVFVGFNRLNERVFRVYFLLPEPPQLSSFDNDLILPRSRDSLGHDVELVGANIQVKRSTNFVTYMRDPITHAEIFTAKAPYRLALLKNGDATFWRHKRGPYPDRVLVTMNRKGGPYCRFGFPSPKPEPDPKPFLLDVATLESTDCFQYQFNALSQTHSFTPNPGFLIYEVSSRGKLLWSCEDSLYPEKVIMFPNKRGNSQLRIKLPSIIPTKPTHQGCIEIITRGSKRPNDEAKYTLTQPSSGRLIYSFKPGAQCTMVRCNGRILWIYGNFNCKDYPTSLLYTNYSVIDIHFGCGFIKYLRLPNGNWSEGIPHDIRTSLIHYNEPPTPLESRWLASNAPIPYQSTENLSLYHRAMDELSWKGRKSVRSADTSTDGDYDGASVVNVRRTRSHVAGIRYDLNDLNLHTNKESSKFRHRDFKSSYRPQQHRASQTTTQGYKPEFRDKFLVPLDLNEIASTPGYYVQNKPDKTIYIAQPGYLFGIVTSNGETLWKTKRGDYPNKVIYKTVDGQNRLKVYFPEPMPPPRISSLKVVRPVRDQYGRVERPRPRYGPSDPSKVAIEITDPHRPDFKFFRYVEPERIPAESIPKIVDTRREAEAAEPAEPFVEVEGLDPGLRVRLLPGVKTGERRRQPIPLPMSMNIDEPLELHYDYEPWRVQEREAQVKSETEAKPDAQVKAEAEDKAKETDYEASSDLEDESDMRHRGVIKYVTLNIQNKETRRSYRFFEDIRTQTAFYFPKVGFLFNKVQLTRQYHALAHDLYYQWKANKVFAKMVMVNGIDDVQPFVSIFLTDGQILFYCVAYINSIHLGTRRFYPEVDLNTDEHPQNVRIYTLSSSGERMNDVRKYEVSTYVVPNGTHPMASYNPFYRYMFKSARYLRITINSRLLWESGSGPRPQALYYFPTQNLAVLEFDYHSYNVYKFQSDMWFLWLKEYHYKRLRQSTSWAHSEGYKGNTEALNRINRIKWLFDKTWMHISRRLGYLVIFLLSYRPRNQGHLARSTQVYDSYGDLPFDSTFADPLTVVEIKNLFSTNEINYKYDKRANFHEFIAKQPYLIDKVTRNGRIIWDSANYDYEYGSKVVVGENNAGGRLFRVYFPHETGPIFSDSGSSCKSIPKAAPQEAPRLTKLLNIDIKYKFTTNEVLYTYNETDDTHTFRAVEPYVFNQIYKNGVIVWEYEQGAYPNEALVTRDEAGRPMLRVFFNKPPEVAKHDYRPQISKPVQYRGPVLRAPIPTHERVQTEIIKIVRPPPKVDPIPIPDTETERETEPDTQLETELESQFESESDGIPRSKRLTKTKKLHIDTESEPEVEVEEKPSLKVEDQPRPKVDERPKPKVVERPRPKVEEYPRPKVEEYPRPKVAAQPKRMAVVPKAGLLDMRPVELNVDYRYSTFCFDYTQYDNVGTYIAKEGYAIIVVRLTYKFLIFGTDVVIWRSRSPELYATKVVLTGISNVANTLTLYLNNGETKTYKKSSDRQIWLEADEVAPEEPDPLDLDPSLLDIDIDNFSKSIVYDIRYVDDEAGKINYVYAPKKKYLFKSVRQESYIVWKAADKSECASIVHVVRYTFPDIINLMIMTPDGNRRLYVKNIPRLCKLPTWKEASIDPINKRIMSQIRRVVPF